MIRLHPFFARTLFLFLSSTISIAQQQIDICLITKKNSGYQVNEKVEIGVNLPNELQEKVDNFIEGIGSPNEQLNPYLEWELRVFAEFSKADNDSSKIIVEGFYYKEFDAWSAKTLPEKSSYIYTSSDFRKFGGYKPKETNFPFRIRFAPPEHGTWTAKIKFMVKGKSTGKVESVEFVVNDEVTAPYISIASNKRFFSDGNHVFLPFGMNIPWPESDKSTDPEVAKYLCGYSDYDKKVMCGNEGYMDVYVAPRAYQKYRQLVSRVADNGANSFRMMMYPTATEIEWEELGNYTRRLHMAQEMDSILATAEMQGMYILWNMQIHYTFQKSMNAYYRTWTWDKKMNGYDYCYKRLVKSGSPIDFFTSEEAKKFYKQRIRYIIARWGYSPNILGFELFSEISNVGANEADNSEYYKTGENYKIYRNWQVEMGNYVKTFYYGKKHLLSASFAGEKAAADDTFHDPAFDFMSSNIYDFGKPDFATNFTRMTGSILNEARGKDSTWNSYVYNNQHFNQPDYHIRKPMIYSETDANGSICDSTVVELRRAVWQSYFSGLAASFSWEFRFRNSYYSTYNQIKSLMSMYDLAKSDWHPGTMQNQNTAWLYRRDYAEKMNPKMKYRRNKGKVQGPADVSFLRSGDNRFAFGVITNKTYNGKSVDTCNVDDWSGDYEMLLSPRSVNLEKEGPSVPGMERGKYEIEYFYVNDPNRAIGYSTSSGPNLRFDFTIPANDFNYIVIFRAKKVDASWSEVSSTQFQKQKTSRSK